MKVAITIDSIKHGGGAEKNAVALAEMLGAQGISVVLVTFYSYDNEYPYHGVRVSFEEVAQTTFFGKLRKAVGRLKRIREFCAEEKITHVISFLEEANNYTILAKLLLRNRPKLVVSVRNNPRILNWRRKAAILFLYRFAHSVVSVSQSIEAYLRKSLKLRNVTTIYNPIDVNKVKALADEPLPAQYVSLFSGDGPIFINVGRLHRQKGQIYLIRAFAAFAKTVPSARLLILGEGIERAALEQCITGHNLEGQVQLLGHQKNIYPFLKRADCYVCSSLWEGFPNVLLEAAAVGLYIISTDCESGPAEILKIITYEVANQYPMRTRGGSLLPDPASDEEIIRFITREMVWYNSINNEHFQPVLLDKFAPNALLEEWVTLLQGNIRYT